MRVVLEDDEKWPDLTITTEQDLRPNNPFGLSKEWFDKTSYEVPEHIIEPLIEAKRLEREAVDKVREWCKENDVNID